MKYEPVLNANLISSYMRVFTIASLDPSMA